MKALISWISKHFYLICSLLVLSCLQSMILVYGNFGEQAILANLERSPGVKVSGALILNYLNQLGILTIGVAVTVKTILLFSIQCLPASIYSCCQSIKSKRIASLTIWLSPALIALPTVVGAVAYLLSPLFSIGFFISLVSDKFDKEDFADGLFFIAAAIGWFNLFWLGVTIRSWLFLKHASGRAT